MVIVDARTAFIFYNTGGPFDILPASAKFILGQYAEDDWHHGKRVYKRLPTPEQKFLPELKLYFWDESDGKELMGWWCGEDVGCGRVWSHNTTMAPLPPTTGWRCPADGPVQEHIVCVQPVRPPKPTLRVMLPPKPMLRVKEEPVEPFQAWGPCLKRPHPSELPDVAAAKRPEVAYERAEALVFVSTLGKDAPWGTQHLLGEYAPRGENHGRRALCRRRDPRTPEEEPVWLYYWDARDGPELNGWWIGRRVGGGQRFGKAEDSSSSTLPPLKGWRVPCEGAVRQDLRFVPQGQSEEVAMTEEERLAAATAVVVGVEAEAYKAVEASQFACGLQLEDAVESAMGLLKASASSVEEALASLTRHEQAARKQPGRVWQEVAPLRERLQVLLESVQQELSRATWRSEAQDSKKLAPQWDTW